MPPRQAHSNGKHDMKTIVVVIVLVIILLIFSFAGNFTYFLHDSNNYLNRTLHLDKVGHILMIAMYIFSTFFIFVISYCVVRLFEIRRREKEHLEHEIEEYAHMQAEQEKKKQEGGMKVKNERWNQVITFLFSPNPNDWRLAVIEADSMLDVLMDQLGFKGENLGEKLKTADRDKFHSLSSAWEVHVVRNRIAHEGSQFELSHYEAKRIIALYEQIFREFDFI